MDSLRLHINDYLKSLSCSYTCLGTVVTVAAEHLSLSPINLNGHHPILCLNGFTNIQVMSMLPVLLSNDLELC